MWIKGGRRKNPGTNYTLKAGTEARRLKSTAKAGEKPVHDWSPGWSPEVLPKGKPDFTQASV